MARLAPAGDMEVMQEVTLRIRFNRVCPGAVRKGTGSNLMFAMQRDAEGRVLFLPTWWSSIARYAAKVLNKNQREAKQIDWNPVIDGETSIWNREVPPQSGKDRKSWYVSHEAFLQSENIGVHCVLPEHLCVDDFWQLMSVAGSYKGISPYKHSESYGTFEVVSITPRRRSVGTRETKE